ncbi:MAG TPA: tyrosine-type recombinase/integrase [Microbacteriaceae bacterium]|nr:tyrosine-type recombinase/integrase [Microbacteriaceae bacterium]
MTISPEWGQAIAGYLAAQRLAGRPRTTIYTRRQHLEHLARRVDVGPWVLTASALLAYAEAQTWAAETRRGRRTTFISFWRWARKAGHTVRNPAKHLPAVTASEPNPMPVSDEDYRLALAKASPRERLMLRLAAEMGLRRAEVAQVHSRDLMQDLVGWSLLVHGKGGKTRLVPATDRIARDLRDLGEGYAFPGGDDGHLSPRWVGKLIGRLLPGAYTMHKLRHRAATRVHQASGGDTFITQDFLGHASPATTRRYVRVVRAALRAAVLEAAEP